MNHQFDWSTLGAVIASVATLLAGYWMLFKHWIDTRFLLSTQAEKDTAQLISRVSRQVDKNEERSEARFLRTEQKIQELSVLHAHDGAHAEKTLTEVREIRTSITKVHERVDKLANRN